jgi:hypothetical protein
VDNQFEIRFDFTDMARAAKNIRFDPANVPVEVKLERAFAVYQDGTEMPLAGTGNNAARVTESGAAHFPHNDPQYYFDTANIDFSQVTFIELKGEIRLIPQTETPIQEDPALFDKTIRINTPHKISVISMIKNEAPYIKEWIEYHKIIGVEKFYIFDNYSDDNTKEVLQPYIVSQEVEYELFPETAEKCDLGTQVSAFHKGIEKAREESKWVAMIDADEFIVPMKYKTIPEFLDTLDDTTAEIEIDWVYFGYNGQYAKPEGLVVKNYTKRYDGRIMDDLPKQWPWMYERYAKCIVNPRAVIT